MDNKNNFDTSQEKVSVWGQLLNQNPTIFARSLIESGVEISLIKEHLIKNYSVKEKQAGLVYQILRSQKAIIRNDKLINLHINIDFDDNAEDYLNALKKEIMQIKQLISSKTYLVRSILVSGKLLNLNFEDIKQVLSLIAYPVSEITVSCDNISEVTEEKLLILKSFGVTRLVLPVQSFVVKTLNSLKNKHTVNEVFSVYMLALKHNFVVDFKLGVGINQESLMNLKKTLMMVKELSPQNLYFETENIFETETMAQKEKTEQILIMQEYVFENLLKIGYKPYFIEKEKGCQLWSKLGFAQDGKICLFNVDYHQQTLSVIACGNGATSKKVVSRQNAVFQVNPLSSFDYINNIEIIIKEKQDLF